MRRQWLYALRSGKNSKFLYYLTNYLRLCVPTCFFRWRLPGVLRRVDRRADKDYIRQRVDYYNRLSEHVSLPPAATRLSAHKIPARQKVYFFDTYRFTRWFPQSLRWGYCPGDVTFVPSMPSVVKTRPLVEHNENAVVMKLDRVRHFIFVNDRLPFTSKEDKVIFRGKVNGKPARRTFMEMYFHHPLCDLGDVSRQTTNPQAWRTVKKTLREHLTYKFIMALEGNDVASNLKWVMSSNSIAVMPRPTCESWFMEGTLIPDYHYIEIKPDFSDLEERLRYYIAHADKAQEIIDHAHEYVAQFRNRKREELISLLVLGKYFEKTGQKFL